MARDWDKYEADVREAIERKVAHTVERAKRRAERAEERAGRHATRASKSAEWYAERAKAHVERQTERAKDKFERAGRRCGSLFGMKIHGFGCDGKDRDQSEIVSGIIILLVGAALLFSNLGLFSFGAVLRLWPVALILFGIQRLARAKFPSAVGFGIFLMAAGVLFLLSNFGVFHLAWNVFWPAILILIGLQHLLSNFDPPEVKAQQEREWAEKKAADKADKAGDKGMPVPGPETATSGPRSTNYSTASGFAGAGAPFAATPPQPQPPPPPGPAAMEPDVHLHEYCIFTGGKRRIMSNNFRGGEIVAVFGGVDVDLRNSQIGGDEAIVDITAAFGGCTLRVPESWFVDMRGVAAFGGYNNKTIPPRLSPGQKVQKLTITGSAAFGGVVIEN